MAETKTLLKARGHPERGLRAARRSARERRYDYLSVMSDNLKRLEAAFPAT